MFLPDIFPSFCLTFFFILLLLVLFVSPGIKINPVKAYLANGNRRLSNKEPSPVLSDTPSSRSWGLLLATSASEKRA